tara:strand:- start:4566 stop:4742 length:177 start_codon:yes stop_codon:yes gene_type:complete
LSRITIQEARRNLREMESSLDEEHVKEIKELIMKREMEELSDEEFREEYSEVIADGSD